MTWESALSPTLEQTLNLIVSALANFFGTTTEAILRNAPTWLVKYGWYVTLHDELIGYIFGGVFAGIVIVGIFLFIYEMADKEYGIGVIIVAFLIFIVVIVIAISIPIITCMIAPEIVGIEAAIKLIS